MRTCREDFFGEEVRGKGVVGGCLWVEEGGAECGRKKGRFGDERVGVGDEVVGRSRMGDAVGMGSCGSGGWGNLLFWRLGRRGGELDVVYNPKRF